MSAFKFIQLVARKKVAQESSTGIPTIGNKLLAESKAEEIAETFRLSGLTSDKWDQFIKNEKDVIKYLNIIEATKKQAIKQATEAAPKGILKTTKKKEKPFTGWTPEVVEKSMPADDYAALKDEWFTKIIANTDDDINTFLKKGIDAADERFINLSKTQRKDFLDMVEYRLKHGNKKFMNDFTDVEGKFKLPPEDLAGGGIAGMLGEPTYEEDNHRVPLKYGKRPDIWQQLLDEDWDYMESNEWENILKSVGAYQDGGRIGYANGTPNIKFYPKASGIFSSESLSPEVDLKKRDINYGLTTLIEGDKFFGGAELGKGKIKVDVVDEDGSTYFKDTISKDDAINFILGMGDPEGEKFQVKVDDDFENMNVIFNKKFKDGGRIGFKNGTKFNPKRRTFLKIIGGLAALPVVGKFFKFAKPAAKIADVTEVPIRNIKGMPSWFKPLVNKVIKEGEQMKVTEYDRLVTHKSQLPNSKTDIYVNQDLNTGDVWVDIGAEKHGFPDGKFGQPVRLEYKAAENVEPVLTKKGKTKYSGGKTKEEFNVEEAEFTGGHPENVKFEETSVNKFGQHESNFDEVEMFATGKVKKTRNISSLQKQNEDLADHFSNMPTPDDFASGGIIGRVPYWKGGSWNMIKEAIKLNKIFGLGGPPYKPGATSFDIKKLTKDRFGTELSLQELKEMGITKENFSKFLGGFKEYKASVIKQQLLKSKNDAQLRIKVSKDMLKNSPEGVDPALNNQIQTQMIRNSEKRLKDIEAALQDIDVYKAMKEKTGVASHALGGRVSLSSGGIARMLGE